MRLSNDRKAVDALNHMREQHFILSLHALQPLLGVLHLLLGMHQQFHGLGQRLMPCGQPI